MVGRLLGVDHGDRRIGLALSDPIPMIATPLKTLTVVDAQEAIEAILAIVKEYAVVLVIVGLPIGMKGQDTAQTKHVKKFADDLKDNGINVALQDERLTSVSAKRSIMQQQKNTNKNKGLIDRTAAAILLQQYIDKHYNG
ncbi:MAG: Holliday junction resolvase RuvX [Planctomycetia bacterium]|nr:Holliday junction resolvase RuvX [Planctomycetia bacterium]